MSIKLLIVQFFTVERIFYWLVYNAIFSGLLFGLIAWRVIIMGDDVAWSAPQVVGSNWELPPPTTRKK